jgi:transcriptional regulator with XRE-family HTH domain
MRLDDAHRKLLTDRRIELGLDQRQLAKKLGITNTRVCQLERGTNGPSPELLKRWAEAMGVHLDYTPAVIRLTERSKATPVVSARTGRLRVSSTLLPPQKRKKFAAQ